MKRKRPTPKIKSLLCFLLLGIPLIAFAQQIGVGHSTTVNSISDDSANSPSLTNFTDFGTETSRKFYIDNTQTSNSTLTITSITLSNNSDFIISSALGDNTITRNQTPVPFTISLNGSSCGNATSTVEIVSDATNDGIDNTWVFTISASKNPEMDVLRGASPILISNTDTPSSFSNVYVGATSAVTYTIKNNGNCDLDLTGVLDQTTLTNATDFTVDYSATSSTILSGESTTFDIIFNPVSLGTKSTSISIANNDPTGGENPYTFSISGTCVLPTYSDVVLSVRWPANSGENRLKVYTPSGVLLATIDDGFDDSLGNFNTTQTFLCLEDLNNYYFVMEDSKNDGWQGTDNITITIDGTQILNSDNIGDGIKTGPITKYFNVSGGTCGAKIDVKGVGNSILGDGTNTPYIIDDTDFGTVQIASETAIRTYTIENIGSDPITLGSISLVGDTKFNLVSFPALGTVLSSGATAEVKVSFSTLTETQHTAILTINSDAINTPNYVINISAEGGKVFFDSDDDGIYDDIDIDDDNDGVEDGIEEEECNRSSSAVKANYKFLNETFGAGATRASSISTLYSATTSYCYEDGITGSSCNSSSNSGLNDGEYTVHHMITTGVSGETVGPTNAIASWANYAWANIEDHTLGDTQGRMAIFNADYDPGIFYETKITGTLTGIPITYSFYVINIDNKDSKFSSGELDATGHRILPNVTVRFLTTDRTTVLAEFFTGDITRCSGDIFVPADHTGPGPHVADASYNQCETSEWKYFQQNLTLATESAFIVQFINNAPGGLGNDLAIDDIEIKQTLCDTDGDGVANIFDLDSDDDGIPDVVENGYGLISLGTGKIGIITDNSPKNGMHDIAQTYNMVDTDGDGVPNYLDLDSDNDGLFDVDESGATNTLAYAGYQNGDGDISGDGTGDSIESETFREKDTDGDGTREGYGDGILDIYDYFISNTGYADSYGNSNQGNATSAGWVDYVVDTDDDGIPDYMDLFSNDDTNSDITKRDIINILHLYPGIDSDNNGKIDGVGTSYVYTYTNPPSSYTIIDDADGDGILDAIDTSDSDGITDAFDGNATTFGSPRDIDQKLLLYFDGRNDYVEDVSIISGETTLMGWIKIDAAPLGVQRVFGQNNFYIQIDGSRNISAHAGGKTLIYATAIDLNQWVHIAATYNNNDFKLYINGIEVKTTTTGSAITADASSFTIGRISDTEAGYFKGYLDEVRVFSKALTENELQKIVYQEIEEKSGIIYGSVVKIDIDDFNTATEIATALPWTNLQRYFRMDTYKDDIIDDLSTASIDIGSGAKMYNMKIIKTQTAPLPFVTQIGNTDLAMALTTTTGINGNDAITSPASIVKIEHNGINSNQDQTHVALFVSSGNEYTMNGTTNLNGTDTGHKLEVSRYLYLGGSIDLEGGSQLVQGGQSILDENSGGYLERDQQGTANSYNYNYWTSSVEKNTGGGLPTFNASTNGTYKINDILKDGTNSVTPLAINFNGAYNWADSGVTTPIKISSRWFYTFYGKDDLYEAWAKIDQNSPIAAGDGYSMKGTSGDTEIGTVFQNYVFKGKPYNGEIKLELKNSDGIERDRLIGNPYASALDADEFIKDNIKAPSGRNTKNIFNGALYFWDHFGEQNSHILKEYVGGYATYTLMGGTPAVANDARINTTSGKTAIKTPGQYVPVGQGFFVITAIDYQADGITPEPGILATVDGGFITFKNSQRAFQLESLPTGNSVFMKAEKSKETTAAEKAITEDIRPKIRLIFDSPKGYHRQLLIGADENTTTNFDIGYDGAYADSGIPEDVYWNIQGVKSVIQGVPNFNEDQEFPLSLKIAKTGLARIKVDALENIDSSTNIYIKDALAGTTTKINSQPFEITLDSGTYVDRFSLTFAPQKTLNVENEILEQGLLVFMNNATNELEIRNTVQAELQSIQLYNTLGQLQNTWNKNLESTNFSLPINNKATGIYFVQLNSITGTVTKKVVME